MLLPFYFARLYPHSILCTRSFAFHICTLDWNVCRRSLAYFSPWDITWTVLHLNAVEYLPAYVCDPYMLLLLLFPPLFVRKAFLIFLRYLFSAVRIFLFSYTLVQTLYGTGICMLSVQTSLFHYLYFYLYSIYYLHYFVMHCYCLHCNWRFLLCI